MNRGTLFSDGESQLSVYLLFMSSVDVQYPLYCHAHSVFLAKKSPCSLVRAEFNIMSKIYAYLWSQ